MADIGSTADTNSLLQAAKRAPVVSARQTILQNIGADNPKQQAALKEKLSSLEKARDNVAQARQDMTAARKEAVRQKIARIKAQLQSLYIAGGSAASRAKKVARMARELAAAVREYKAAGGTGSVVTPGAHRVGGVEATTTGVTDVVSDTAAVSLSATLGDLLSRTGIGQSTSTTTGAERKADKAFAEDVRFLTQHLKNQLRASKVYGRRSNKISFRTDQHGANQALSQVARDLAGFGVSASSVRPISFDVTI